MLVRLDGTLISQQLFSRCSCFFVLMEEHQSLYQVNEGGNVLPLHSQALGHQVVCLRHVVLQIHVPVQLQSIPSPAFGEEARRVLWVLQFDACSGYMVAETEHMTLPAQSLFWPVFEYEPGKAGDLREQGILIP